MFQRPACLIAVPSRWGEGETSRQTLVRDSAFSSEDVTNIPIGVGPSGPSPHSKGHRDCSAEDMSALLVHVWYITADYVHASRKTANY